MDLGFVFWGVFAFYGLFITGYLIWMRFNESFGRGD